MSELVSLNRPQLVALKCYDSTCFPVECNELDLEGRAVIVAMNDGAYVAGRELVQRHILGEDGEIMFLERCHVGTTGMP